MKVERPFRHCYSAATAIAAALLAGQALASTPTHCPVTYQQLEQALRASVHASGGPENGGLPVNEWAAVVDRAGQVCAVARSGAKAGDQWLGSRSIAVEKADTANAFDLDKYAISTANLWAASQPGGYLYGANVSNPAVPVDLYAGPLSRWGTASDPLVGETVGGVIDFAGGLGLYDKSGVVGGLGASGNTSCADQNIAWRIREKLHLNMVRNGPSPHHDDEIIYDVGPNGKSKSGWGHPRCGGLGAAQVAQVIHSGVVTVKVASAGKGGGQAR
ncbi:MAG: GlcG/HbpS family heme-binding protein [Steroidobacteraceae bacterium]